MTSTPDLARALTSLAEVLEARGVRAVGVLRQGARRLVEQEVELDRLRGPIGGPGRCPSCGRPIEQPATGRRRRYCSPRCRSAARNARNARVDP